MYRSLQCICHVTLLFLRRVILYRMMVGAIKTHCSRQQWLVAKWLGLGVTVRVRVRAKEIFPFFFFSVKM